MKGRRRKLAFFAGIFSVWMGMAALAGQWESDENGRWWQNEDGSRYTEGWHWIDADGDGLSACYYFGADGCLLTDTETPDGYRVDADGAWIEDGVVQMRDSAAQAAAEETQAEASSSKYKDDYSGMYTVPAPDGYTRTLTIGYREETNSISVSFGRDSNRYLYWGVVNGLTYFELDPDPDSQYDHDTVAFAGPGVVRWKNYDGTILYVERE